MCASGSLLIKEIWEKWQSKYWLKLFYQAGLQVNHQGKGEREVLVRL